MKAVKEILKSWWVLLFFLGCGIVLEKALDVQRFEYAKLSFQWSHLQREKERLLMEQENLRAQVNSQSDPAWVELTLMRKMGLVPEGQRKVLFN